MSDIKFPVMTRSGIVMCDQAPEGYVVLPEWVESADAEQKDETLPARMRTAAEVVRDASKAFHSRPENNNNPWVGIAWTPDDLCLYADLWDAEEADKASQEREVEALARVLRRATVTCGIDWDRLDDARRGVWKARAREILDAGYRKADQ